MGDTDRFNVYVNMVNARIRDLVQIYINDRKRSGDGMLFIDFTNKEKMDVFYNPIHDLENECANPKFPEDLLNYMKDREVPSSIIFFNIFDSEGNFILEVDLDKHK